MPLIILLLLAAAPIPIQATPGDLNGDGVVDFADFFILADNFGKTRPPAHGDTIIVIRRDTLVHFVERERVVRDTVEVLMENRVTLHDTVLIEERVTLHDTVFIEERVTLYDTVEVDIGERVTLHDTVLIRTTQHDTVYIDAGPERPPVRPSWADIVDEVRPGVYWIGFTAKPRGNTRYDITFTGTGFAVDDHTIATNYHVASYVDEQLKLVRADLEPVMIAVRSGTQVFGEGTHYLGTVDEARNLLGFWDPRYDGTVNSSDLALFPAYDPDGTHLPVELKYLHLAPMDALVRLRVGDDVGVLGFPGVLETNHDPYTLSPTPTFKSGTISALRSYDDVTSLSRAWEVALIGKIVQHNLEIAPGNSGSPVFNRRGEVVAIAHAGIDGGNAFDFAIRADELRQFLKALYQGMDIGEHINAKRIVGTEYATRPYPRPR